MPASLVFPPSDVSKCVVVVANGEMETTPQVQRRIKSAASVIGVDGGLNHCHRMGIKPEWVVGDFDSVDPSILQEMSAGVGAARLARAKDETDLEVALEKAKQISNQAQIIIFGGLGGRIDHTLGNIYLLLRNPGKVYLESENQILFVVDQSLGRVKISHPTFKTLSLFPLNGKAKGVSIGSAESAKRFSQVDKSCRLALPFSGDCFLNIDEGELVVCLDKREMGQIKERSVLPLSRMERGFSRCYFNMDYADVLACTDRMRKTYQEERGPTPADFSLSRPLIEIFEDLRCQSNRQQWDELAGENMSVFNIQSGAGKVTFPCQIGQTISLIPLYGPASGISTSGLKWELGPSTLDRLDKHFVGISNVCMGNTFSVQVEKGELLCVINHQLIDMELVNAQIKTNSQRGENMTQPVQQTSKAPIVEESAFQRYAQASLLGAGRGLLGLAVEHPFDVVKTKLQAELSVGSARSVVREIFDKRGVRGFYSGVIPNGIRLAGKQFYRWPMMVYFPVYFRRELPDSIQKKYPASAEVATGLTIANLEAGLINPLERLKVFLMTNREKDRQITQFFRQNREHIFREMTRGMGAMFPRQNASWVSFLVADKKVKDWERKNTGQQKLSWYSLFKVSLIVGLINTAANMPFDVAKTQLQKCNFETGGLFKTMGKILQTHGIRGLYAGGYARMVQYMIQSAFTVPLLDKLQNAAASRKP